MKLRISKSRSDINSKVQKGMRKSSDRFTVSPVLEMANNNFNERAVDVERSALESDRKMSFAQWTR